MNFFEWLLGMILGKDFVFGKKDTEDKDKEDNDNEHDDDIDGRAANNEP